MYVCLCNGLTDARIRDAVAGGASTCCQVYAACGCRARCGGCARTVVAMLRAGAAATATAAVVGGGGGAALATAAALLAPATA